MANVTKNNEKLLPKTGRNVSGPANSGHSANNALRYLTYKGAVPLQSFIGWVLLVVIGALLVGVLAANLLVGQRLSQLVQDTATRVQLQAQGRGAVVQEWLNSVSQWGSSIEGAEVVRLYMMEVAKVQQEVPAGVSETVPADGGLRSAVLAQKPYMQQLLSDFMAKHSLLGAQLVHASGQVLLQVGDVPSVASERVREVVKEVVEDGTARLLPLRVTDKGVVLDVVRPVLALHGNERRVNAELGPVAGVLWYTVQVGDKLAELVAATPLDRAGERTALVQRNAVGNNSSLAEVVGRTGLGPLPEDFETLLGRMGLDNGGNARVVQRSLVDSEPVFAALQPIGATPLALLQEYVASDALGLMRLYKPGIYTIVGLLVVVLGALMLALTLHLMAQRNKTRVKLLGQTMEALVRVVEARDPYLAGHHAKLARLVVQVGNHLKMNVGDRATLYYAAQMAAVGRLLVPRDMLAKKGKLSPAERSAMEQHINQAVNILGGLEFDLPIVPVIAQMYERENGSGHPLGLNGRELSQMGKVLGTCDAFVAMTSERAHRAALTKTEALKAMEGGAFSAEVVAAVKAVWK